MASRDNIPKHPHVESSSITKSEVISALINKEDAECRCEETFDARSNKLLLKILVGFLMFFIPMVVSFSSFIYGHSERITLLENKVISQDQLKSLVKEQTEIIVFRLNNIENQIKLMERGANK